MSLINKMLQDLEQRKDGGKQAQPLVGDVHAVAGSAASLLPRTAVWTAVLLLGMAAAGAAWHALRPAPPQPHLIEVIAPTTELATAPATTPIAEIPAASASQAQALVQPPTVIELAQTTPPPQQSTSPATRTAPVVQSALKKPSLSIAAGAPLEPASAAPAAIDSPLEKSHKHVSVPQQAENLYKQALAQLQQGHGSDARHSLQQILVLAADHVKARQLLAALLVEANALDDSAALLREGLQRSPGEAVFSIALARIQVEKGDPESALQTLSQGLPAAGDDPQYHAFYAVLLQRAQRHDDAVQHYLIALRSDPAMPTWLVGIGISLQAQGKDRDAALAFARARDGGLLSASLLAFVEQRLRQLH